MGSGTERDDLVDCFSAVAVIRDQSPSSRSLAWSRRRSIWPA